MSTDLIQAADQARSARDWQHASHLYTRALEMGGLPPVTEYELRSARADCYRHLGNLYVAQEDLEVMAQLAEALDDVPRRITSLNRQASITELTGELAAGRAQAETALALAEQGEYNELQVDSLCTLGYQVECMGDIPQAQSYYEQALRRARGLDHPKGEASARLRLGSLATFHLGQPEQAQVHLNTALAVYRQLGDEHGESRALNILGWATTDLARRRDYFEQALSIVEVTGDQPAQAALKNDLGVLYGQLGLYQRAREYAEGAVQLSRGWQSRFPQAVYLITLAGSCLGLEAFDLAGPVIDKSRAVASQIGSRVYETAYPALLLGMVALGRDQPTEAQKHLAQAAEGYAALAMPAFQAVALAWLGAAELALGRVQAAREHTAQAIAIPTTTSKFPPQEVWWWRYQALLEPSGDGDQPLTYEAWQALDRAQKLTLESIATLSDEGLRRNYLNKVAVNRNIVLDWTRHAVQRGVSLAPFLEREAPTANLQDQVRRLVTIGNRLTGLPDPDALPQFILEEFVELSGAERAFLVLDDEWATADFNWTCAIGMRRNGMDDAKSFSRPILQAAKVSGQPVLRKAEGKVPPGGVPALHQRSALGLPLVSRGKLQGLLYGDLRQIFGRFTQADLDLLTLLANQAAAALENAAWMRTLERQVEERTAKLAALAEAGQDITATLDLDTALARITENARQLLRADTSSVYLLQGDGQTLRYIAGAGPVQDVVKAYPLQVGRGIIGYIVQSGIAEIIADTSQDPRTTPIPGGTATSAAEKLMVAPLFSRGHVIGAMVVWRSQARKVFEPADLEFLVALSRQVAIAIENARLFTATEQARLEAEAARGEAEIAQAHAEHASQAKSAFLANVSHELRTPLNAIIGFTRIVRRKATGVLPERQVENLAKVLVSAEHLLGLINTLLDIAKIEAGRMDVNPSEFHPAALVETCLTAVHPLVRRGVVLETDIAPTLPRAVSDQDKLKQILINLLSNAVKFTHSGRIVVAVTHQNDHITFAVSDTGIGISQDALPTVFDEFQQAEHDTRQKYGGTGLGLAISRSLARLLGGDLTATSTHGQGSTFTLTVPMHPNET